MSDLDRLAIVQIGDEVLRLLFDRTDVVESGVPEDTTILRLYEDPARHAWMAVCQSEEFDVVNEGASLPTVGVEWMQPDERPVLDYEDGRTRKELCVTYEVLSLLLRDDVSVEHDLPNDTSITKRYDVPTERRFEIGLHSEEFDRPEEGNVRPWVDGSVWRFSVPETTTESSRRDIDSFPTRTHGEPDG